MTNTQTYSNESASIDSLHPLGLTEHSCNEHHYMPHYMSDHTAEVLDNLAHSFHHVHDVAADNGAMAIVGAVVTVMFTMAVAIGLCIRG